jgi:hypothetical protein
MRISSLRWASSSSIRSLSALSRSLPFMLSTAQLRVYTLAYWVREMTCNMAERMCLFQDFGRGIRGGFLPDIVFSETFRTFSKTTR